MASSLWASVSSSGNKVKSPSLSLCWDEARIKQRSQTWACIRIPWQTGLLKHCWAPSRGANSIVLGLGAGEICISNQFPGAADAPGSGTLWDHTSRTAWTRRCMRKRAQPRVGVQPRFVKGQRNCPLSCVPCGCLPSPLPRAGTDWAATECLTWDFQRLGPPRHHCEWDQIQAFRGCDHWEYGALPHMSSQVKQY